MSIIDEDKIIQAQLETIFSQNVDKISILTTTPTPHKILNNLPNSTYPTINQNISHSSTTIIHSAVSFPENNRNNSTIQLRQPQEDKDLIDLSQLGRVEEKDVDEEEKVRTSEEVDEEVQEEEMLSLEQADKILDLSSKIDRSQSSNTQTLSLLDRQRILSDLINLPPLDNLNIDLSDDKNNNNDDDEIEEKIISSNINENKNETERLVPVPMPTTDVVDVSESDNTAELELKLQENNNNNILQINTLNILKNNENNNNNSDNSKLEIPILTNLQNNNTEHTTQKIQSISISNNVVAKNTSEINQLDAIIIGEENRSETRIDSAGAENNRKNNQNDFSDVNQTFESLSANQTIENQNENPSILNSQTLLENMSNNENPKNQNQLKNILNGQEILKKTLENRRQNRERTNQDPKIKQPQILDFSHSQTYPTPFTSTIKIAGPSLNSTEIIIDDFDRENFKTQINFENSKNKIQDKNKNEQNEQKNDQKIITAENENKTESFTQKTLGQTTSGFTAITDKNTVFYADNNEFAQDNLLENIDQPGQLLPTLVLSTIATETDTTSFFQLEDQVTDMSTIDLPRQVDLGTVRTTVIDNKSTVTTTTGIKTNITTAKMTEGENSTTTTTTVSADLTRIILISCIIGVTILIIIIITVSICVCRRKQARLMKKKKRELSYSSQHHDFTKSRSIRDSENSEHNVSNSHSLQIRERTNDRILRNKPTISTIISSAPTTTTSTDPNNTSLNLDKSQLALSNIDVIDEIRPSSKNLNRNSTCSLKYKPSNTSDYVSDMSAVQEIDDQQYTNVRKTPLDWRAQESKFAHRTQGEVKFASKRIRNYYLPMGQGRKEFGSGESIDAAPIPAIRRNSSLRQSQNSNITVKRNPTCPGGTLKKPNNDNKNKNQKNTLRLGSVELEYSPLDKSFSHPQGTVLNLTESPRDGFSSSINPAIRNQIKKDTLRMKYKAPEGFEGNCDNLFVKPETVLKIIEKNQMQTAGSYRGLGDSGVNLRGRGQMCEVDMVGEEYTDL